MRGPSAPRLSGPTGGFTVDAQTRNAVVAFYHQTYKASVDVASGWDGNVDTCNEGAISNDYRDAMLRRINFYRAMCALPANLALDTNWNQACQEAALMMSANRTLSHYPPPTWTCWTWDGSNAASHANIALGTDGAAAIDAFIEDPGANNYACGHRRWFLYPRQGTIGIGSLPDSPGYAAAAAVWVIGGFGARLATPKYVPWPNEGYCPYDLVFERWSFSMTNADFSAATVNMLSNGAPVTVTIETVADGYGDNTLVWKVAGFPLSGLSTDIPYTVSISNIGVGAGTTSFTYRVTLIDPYTIPEAITISGPETPWVSNSTPYSFTAVPCATAYVVRTSRLTPSTWFEGAEAGTNGVSPHVVAGYAFITNSIKASGAYSFHLAAQWTPQYFSLNRVVRPASNGLLTFKTRMRLATPTQASSAQVSPDEGASWTTLWTKPGTNGDMDNVFETHNLSLGAFTGRSLRVRFIHESDGSSYIGTSDMHGLFVDDIAVSNCQDLADPSVTVVFTNELVFVASNNNDHLIEAAPILGGYAFGYGSPQLVGPSDLWFTGIREHDGQVLMDFNTQSGRLYQFYSADNLGTNSWGSPFLTPTADGASCTASDTASNAYRFFRVIKP